MIGANPEVVMRVLSLAFALLALTTAASAAEQNWIAVCFGEDAQYMQTIGGKGYFHVANGDRTYDTQKLVQSYYDGNMVCGIPDEKAPRATSDIALICANKTTKMVSVLYRRDTVTKMVRPSNALPYCKARIDVL
jgi:hypothetical protein